jgi:hypothetical protein
MWLLVFVTETLRDCLNANIYLDVFEVALNKNLIELKVFTHDYNNDAVVAQATLYEWSRLLFYFVLPIWLFSPWFFENINLTIEDTGLPKHPKQILDLFFLSFLGNISSLDQKELFYFKSKTM